MRRRSAWVFALIAGAAVIAAACGGDDDGGPSGVSTAQPSPSATATPDGGGGGGGATEDPPALAEGVIAGAGNFDWELTRVDRGTKPALILDGGRPVVAYMLERIGSAGFVSVAIGGAEGFVSEMVQDGYHYGPLDLALDANGDLVVAYHNHDWEDAAVGVRRDGVWDVTRVEDAGHDGWDTTLAAASDGSLHVLGIDPAQFGGTDGVEYVRIDGGSVSVTPIGSGPQPYEWGTDIALDNSGVPHGVYFDAAGGDLIYAHLEGDAWVVEAIYTDGDSGRFAVMAIGDDSRVHTAFLSSSGFVEEGRNSVDVVYGVLDGGAWSFEVVATLDQVLAGFTGARRVVAIDLHEGEPTIAYIEDGRVGLATHGGGEWVAETVLEAGADPLQVVGLALDADGAPHLTFSTITSASPLDGEVWYVAPLAQGAASR